MFSPEKKDAITYEDKFLRERYQPSVTQFGGKPVDGWIAVTASGLVSERSVYSPITLQKMHKHLQKNIRHMLAIHVSTEQDNVINIELKNEYLL